MPTFKVNEVVWIRLEDNYWPGIVRKATPSINCFAYQVSFIDDFEVEEESVILQQEMLLPFSQHSIDRTTAALNLIQASEKAIQLNRRLLANKPNSMSQSNKWVFRDLKKFLNQLFTKTPIKNERMEEGIVQIEEFDVKPQWADVYARESVCKIINFIVNQRKINPQLQKALESLKKKMIQVVQKELMQRGCRLIGRIDCIH